MRSNALGLAAVLLISVLNHSAQSQPLRDPTAGPKLAIKNRKEIGISAPKAWQREDLGAFIVYLPKGFQRTKARGVDSAVAEFLNDGAKILFDFGSQNGDPSESVARPDDGIGHFRIAGRPVEFYTDPSHFSVHFFPDKPEGKTLVISTTFDQPARIDLVRRIVRTVRFK